MGSVLHRPPRSAVQRAADSLREEILHAGEGTLLGSEDDLLRRLGVSRPTLRQTARLLEHEQLLLVRRGVNGGYYARNPEVGAVAHMAAFSLRMRGTTLRETIEASGPLVAEALRRAARSEDEEARAKLAAANRGLASLDDEPSVRRMLRDEGELMKHVLALAASPPVELFLRVLYEFGFSETNSMLFNGKPERLHFWIQLRERLVEAILERDVELVALLAGRRREMVDTWMAADVGAGADAEEAHGDAPERVAGAGPAR